MASTIWELRSRLGPPIYGTTPGGIVEDETFCEDGRPLLSPQQSRKLQRSAQITAETGEQQVLRQLARIIDPDFGQDIVSCGFVKGLQVTPQSGQVTFALELTTPACPIKDEFERKARSYVMELPWVQQVSLAPSVRITSSMLS